MTPSSSYASAGPSGWFRRAEAWLDDRGRPAWLVAIVVGFVVFWPIGLALLAYAIWSKRMFTRSCRSSGAHSHRHAWHQAQRPSGNTAFDAYKAETIRRLQDEQQAFEAFLQRLRDAKDKQEFDAFMEDRARDNRADQGEDPPARNA